MKETRTFQTNLSNSGRRIGGVAAPFNVPTTIHDISGCPFQEVIRPGAFKRSIETGHDTRMLRDHNSSMLLGRVKNKTLRIWEEADGLHFEADLPNTPTADEVLTLCRDGYLDECSFMFEVNGHQGETWSKRDGQPYRELRDLNLWDCSVVTFPAYQNGTHCDLRSVNLHTGASTKLLRLKLKLTEF